MMAATECKEGRDKLCSLCVPSRPIRNCVALLLLAGFIAALMWAKANDPFERVEFSLKTASGGSVITIAVTLSVINIALISQTTVNYRKFFTLTTQDRGQAIAQNNRTMEGLRRIIDSDGERTFQDERMGVGGTMGTVLPGNSAYQRAANQFESLANVEGYPTALEELFARLGNRGVRPIPLPDDQTPDQRAELAKALLHRSESFGRWLRRDF